MKAIVINGPMGVGKTATGRAIADMIPGTALIDGDWCMDIHPFVGNRETKAMAVDNILHMVANYRRCSECDMVVLAWLMDDPWVRQGISDGLSALHMEEKGVTLVCDRESLIRRWRQDRSCEWRTDRWLEASLASLPVFASRPDALDTSHLTIAQAAERILRMSQGRLGSAEKVKEK